MPSHKTPEPQHVAFFIKQLEGGGAEIMLIELANGLAEAGLRVDVVLMQAVGVFLPKVSPKVNIVELKADAMTNSVVPMAKYLRAQKPDAVVGFMSLANFVICLASMLSGYRGKKILTVHNNLSMEIARAQHRVERYAAPLVKFLYPKAYLVAAISQGVLDDLRKFVRLKPGQTTLIVPVLSADLEERLAEPADHPWLTDKTVPVFVAVGRLHPQKDYPNLLHAFKHAVQSTPSRLVIFGEGDERPALEALRKELDLEATVDLPGFTKKPLANLAQADAFVLSSRFEGMPAVLIQALAAGVQVIATDCPYGPNEVLKNGKYGQLVPVSNSEELGQAMVRALQNPQRPPRESWAEYSHPNQIQIWIRLLNGQR